MGGDGSVVVGRDAEVARVDAFLEAIPEGVRALLIRGEPGIGKTALWEHAVERCREPGFRVLRSRSAEEEMPFPTVGLIDLFERPGVDRAALDPDLDPSARGRTVLEALRRLAEDAPVVVAIDDVQWLDSVSARALRFALRRLDREPIGVLLTLRDDAGSGDPLTSVLPPGRSATLDLPPLGLDDLRRVLAGTVTSIPRPVLRRIHEVSGGNPLYAIELARSIEGGAGTHERSEIALPGSLQAAISRRLEAVPADLVDLLRVVSALGPTSVGELRPIAGDEVDALLKRAELRALLVVEDDLRVRFSHPLIGSVVYAGMSPLERRELHADLASHAADPDVRARHLARSADEPDAALAQELEEAADRAASRDAFDLSAEFAGHGLRLTPPDDADATLRRAFAEIESLAAAGEVRRALDRSDRLLASLPPGKRRAEAIVRRMQVEDDDLETSSHLLEQALEEAGDDEALQSGVLERLSETHQYMGDMAQAIHRAEQALALAERVGDAEMQMVASANLALNSAIAGAPRPELMERALELERKLGKPMLVIGPQMLVAKLHLWSGDLAASRAICEAAVEEAVRTGNDRWRQQALYDLACAYCAAGDFVAAAESALQGIEAARDSEETWAERIFQYPLALAQAWLGRAGEARATAERWRSVSEERREREGSARALGILGLLELSGGDAADAARHLTEAARMLAEIGRAHPGRDAILPDAVEALASSGDAIGARVLLERLEEQAEAADSASARAAAKRARGALLLAGGERGGAIEMLDDAASRFDELGFRPDAARALLLRGRALLRGGHRTLAADALAEARDRFAGMGARLWEARAVEALDRAAPGRAAGELTRAEGLVAGLVAKGMKNREIAAALFMSVATVEAHLTRIYRKMDIRSRSELARLVADGSLARPDERP
jgi:DNA-binding CsgD family transcriptional regulator